MTEIVTAARDHYEALSSDIANAQNRVEHIRLSALAQSAHNLLLDLIAHETGLDQSTDVQDTPLDIPEFKSPFNPDA